MTDIILTEKKYRDFWSDDRIQNWDPVELTRFPRYLNPDDRVWFTWRGFLKGYFTIKKIDRSSGKVYLNEWIVLREKIPMRSIRGFKYFKTPPV